jgi:hypothetical protein
MRGKKKKKKKGEFADPRIYVPPSDSATGSQPFSFSLILLEQEPQTLLPPSATADDDEDEDDEDDDDDDDFKRSRYRWLKW